jgi:S1-C subfamily serine protease
MSARFEDCQEVLDRAVEDVLTADPQVQALGIARHESGFGFKAVKTAARIVPASLVKDAGRVPRSVRKVPVVVETVAAAIEPVLAAVLPLAASFVPEQGRHRPLACGLQVQNADDDDRQRAAGKLPPGYVTIGTLGCFVKLADGSVGAVSNNHVLAGENRGRSGADRVLQPGDLAFDPDHHVATLADFVPLKPSPATARPARGNVVYNAADAAVARLADGVGFGQAFLPARGLPNPSGVGTPKVGDAVFKVGRTTGLTRGTVTAVAAVVGPVGYDPGNCWFADQFEVVGADGTLFSDHGDSGAAVLNAAGEVVGLVFAGNGTHTYATPVAAVLAALNCTLA